MALMTPARDYSIYSLRYTRTRLHGRSLRQCHPVDESSRTAVAPHTTCKDSFLCRLSTRNPNHLKDIYHFLDIIRSLKLPWDTCPFTLDVDSLYTNIDTDTGLKTVRTIFERYPDRSRTASEILKLNITCRLRARRWNTDRLHRTLICIWASGREKRSTNVASNRPFIIDIWMTSLEDGSTGRAPFSNSLPPSMNIILRLR